MFSFWKRKKSPEDDFASLWEVKDYFELDRIPDIKINGVVKKETAMRFFGNYAAYEAFGHPYAPTISFKNINILLFPAFIVAENRSGEPDAAFVVVSPKTRSIEKAQQMLNWLILESEKDEKGVAELIITYIAGQMDNIVKRFRG